MCCVIYHKEFKAEKKTFGARPVFENQWSESSTKFLAPLYILVQQSVLVFACWAVVTRATFPTSTTGSHYSQTITTVIGQLLATRHATWWRHHMETFSALLAICVGNLPVTGEFPAQRPMTRSFGVFLDLRLYQRLSKQSLGWWFEMPSHPLWRNCNGQRFWKPQCMPVSKRIC